MSIALGKNKKHFVLKSGREDLAAGAMEWSVVRKRGSEEMNKADDMEAEPELLGTMEVDKDEPEENIFYPPEPEALGHDLRDVLGLNDEEWEALQASLAQPKPERKETMKERWLRIEELHKRMDKEREAQDRADQEEIGPDYLVWAAGKFRDDWNDIWSRSYVSFEDTTRIPAMRFTYKHVPDLGVSTYDALQVFSAKVASTSGDVQWPLDVFGFIAIRDTIDHNRNIIFNCTRESSQILTEEDHNLVLVGPTRGVFVSSPHPVTIEVDLKVKGTTELEDKDLSFLAVPLLCLSTHSRLFHCSYTSKLSTLEFTLGHLVSSVEATVFVRVIRGSWLDGFGCEVSAFAVRRKDIDSDQNNVAADIDREKTVLFNSRGEKGIVDIDGNIKLSRRVVSVEIRGELKVSFKAWKVDNDVVEKEEIFAASRAGLSYREIDIGFCILEVSVAWSLISSSPVTTRTAL